MSGNRVYDLDFYEWTQEQARVLREAGAARVDLPVDWENVAEEIESVGLRDVRAATRNIRFAIEQLLKLEFSSLRSPRFDWLYSATQRRIDAARIVEDSPSLSGRLPSKLARCYRDAKHLAELGCERNGVDPSQFPDECPYSLAQVLDPDWYPANRHGLE